MGLQLNVEGFMLDFFLKVKAEIFIFCFWQMMKRCIHFCPAGVYVKKLDNLNTYFKPLLKLIASNFSDKEN